MGLVPYADMINHEDSPNANWYFDTERIGGFSLFALQDIPKGSEITIKYGQKMSNWDLFRLYGFVSENNFHNTMPIRIKMDRFKDP